MGRVVAVLNQKGGVGKTTITLGLASAAASAGLDDARAGAQIHAVDDISRILGVDDLGAAAQMVDQVVERRF